MAKKESQGSFNIVRPLQSACRRISTGLIAPVLRGLKGQRAETSRQRTEGLAVRKERKCSPAGSCVEERSLSDVGFSPPPSPVEVRQRQKTSSCSPILGRRRRRLYQPLFPKTSKVTVLGQGGVGKSGKTADACESAFTFQNMLAGLIFFQTLRYIGLLSAS